MSEQVFDPVAQMGRDGAEIKRLRARVAELEEAIKVLPLENGHTYGCQCRSWLCATRRKALENR